MAELDGLWKVEPLLGVRKRIAGGRGETLVGPLRLRFRVEGLTLRYARPLGGLVDVLEPDGDGFRGRVTVAGRTVGRFRLRRLRYRARNGDDGE